MSVSMVENNFNGWKLKILFDLKIQKSTSVGKRNWNPIERPPIFFKEILICFDEPFNKKKGDEVTEFHFKFN